MFVDIHCHLALKDFEKDLEQIVERAKKANIAFAVSAGCNHEENSKTLDIAKKFPFVRPALGLYPQESEKLSEEQINNIISFIEKNRDRISGIGEVGLDYKNTSKKYYIQKQKKIFEMMIELSEKTKLPLIIHSRMAEEDAFDMVQSSCAKNAVFHCFMGKLAVAKKISDAGHFISIPTNVVFNPIVQEIAREIDINHLVVETDSPFLSPFKYKRNEPAFVVEAVKKIAELKKMKLDEVEEIIFDNSCNIINISKEII